MSDHGRSWNCPSIAARLPKRATAALIVALAVLTTSWAPAKEFEFRAAKHGEGSLQLVDGIPVAVVKGTPKQMGEQLGTLLAAPLADMAAKREALVGGFGLNLPTALLMKSVNLLAGHVPADYLAELKEMAASSKQNYEFLLLGNVAYDLSKIGGCSALLVSPERSATGEILFGRNMDFPTFGFLDRCGLVVVYQPEGKHAFASVTFSGFAGVISGMNDAGLCVAQLEVKRANDGSPHFDPAGVPLAMCFRRVLEECATIDEAERLLSSMRRTSMCNMALCDTKDVGVLEITTKSVVRRGAETGFCACTNHFRTDELSVTQQCDRYGTLSGAFGKSQLDLTAVAHKLDEVNQGRATIHTMIFEPARLRLHLAMGAGPISKQPLKPLDLGPLLKPAAAVAAHEN